MNGTYAPKPSQSSSPSPPPRPRTCRSPAAPPSPFHSAFCHAGNRTVTSHTAPKAHRTPPCPRRERDGSAYSSSSSSSLAFLSPGHCCYRCCRFGRRRSPVSGRGNGRTYARARCSTHLVGRRRRGRRRCGDGPLRRLGPSLRRGRRRATRTTGLQVSCCSYAPDAATASWARLADRHR